MIKSFVYALFRMLSPKERLRVSAWRFRAMREMFYRETRLDIAKKGLRNSETLLERLDTLAERHRKRKNLSWLAFQKIAQRMRAGDDFATAVKPFIPNDEFVLLQLASESPRDDAAIRGLELAEMAAHAKGVLSMTTSMQIAYPAFLIVYLYAFCVLFGSEILPAMLDVKPLEKWSAFGKFVYAFDTFCADYWWLTSSVVAGLVLGYFQTLKRWTGKPKPGRCAATDVAQSARSARGVVDRLARRSIRLGPNAACRVGQACEIRRSVDALAHPANEFAADCHA